MTTTNDDNKVPTPQNDNNLAEPLLPPTDEEEPVVALVSEGVERGKN